MLVGSAVVGLAFSLFLLPHKVVPGGVSGAAMILNHLLNLPVGLTTIVLNLPLFVLGVRVLGRLYGLKSFAGMLLSSGAIDFFTYVVPLQPATDDVILACIFGGIVLGAGLGLVFRSGGSTGGTDILGMVLNRWTNLSTGSALLLIDFVIIALAGLAYGNLELALYGFLNVYVQIRVIDLVLEGVSYTRALMVVSDRAEEIARAITTRLGRGATLLQGTGAWSGSQRPVVLAVMSKKEIPAARELVESLDDRAFVIITDVYEVQGEGFRPRTELKT
jgi:uncharacterized membrane-anchored protein YitT (DUF2179 family)